MARRRRFGRRGSFRGFGRRYKHTRVGTNPLKVIIPAMVWGIGRPYLAQLIAPLTSKLPFGNLADEVGLGLIGYFAAKKGRGLIKDAGIAILTVESFAAGSQLIGTIGGTSSTQTNGWW
jgi:hypothetical protein